MNNFKNSELKDYLFIIFGTLFISLSIVLFFIPNNFTTGGTPGLAILLHELTGFSVSAIIVCVNGPLVLWGTKHIGKKFAIKTLITIALLSFLIAVLSKYFADTVLTNDIFLAAIFGGSIIGLGLGLIIKGNSSAGGSSVVAKIAHAKYGIKPGKIILIIDVIIVLSSIYVFKDIEKALWSITSIYAATKAVDMVLTGTISTKVIHIATNKPEALSLAISSSLMEQGTILRGTDLKDDEGKTILFLAVDVKKIVLLKTIIQETDDEAFMLVMEASEMLGRGH